MIREKDKAEKKNKETEHQADATGEPVGKCEVGAKRSKAGSASWHKDDMPLMKLRLCHTCF